jgi:tetratricopeptide (TPR) repeat protein
MKCRWLVPLSAAAVVLAVLVWSTRAEEAKTLLEKADRQFEAKNYRDAANFYEALLKGEPRHAKAHHAFRRIIICNLRLQLFEPALKAAARFVAHTEGTPHEARAERLLGNLHLTIPHWGTRAGGVFHRGQWKQGIRLRSENHDKALALKHLERARELYAKYDSAGAEALAALPQEERKAWHGERIECVFDLAQACARFGIYERNWRYWHVFWGQRDEFLAETAGEGDFDEYYSHWEWRRKRPIGLRVDAAGKPIFPTAPAAYRADLSDDQRILFLLAEARNLDTTKEHRYAALSWYRQAMLARARFGMDRLNAYAINYWWNGRAPLQEDLGSFNPWELKDGEALVLAGGRIRQVDLPAQWSVIPILRMVIGDYRESGMVSEGRYALGLYHQSRQQYTTALNEYRELLKRDTKSERTRTARSAASSRRRCASARRACSSPASRPACS